MQQLVILGATGSIGSSTLDVVARHQELYQVYALVAGTNVKAMLHLVEQFSPRVVVFADKAAALTFQQSCTDKKLQVLYGESAACQVVSEPDVDIVMSAIVGAAGLQPTLAAIQSGKKVLLANKESLVMAGQLMMDAVRKSKAELLPIDSEHNAIFQCLPYSYAGNADKAGINKIILTASGGPFRDQPEIDLSSVTPEQACAHPNWSMGKKISVDSATLMNKGLEFIEACHLFSVKPNQVDVVIHPQSIVHSMVQYNDGSVLAQLGNPDMRTPIAHALAWPERISSGVEPLDFLAMSHLEFSKPDLNRFPALKIAMQVAKQGQTAPAILNAANEVAVEAFLNGFITFKSISDVVENVLNNIESFEPQSIEHVLESDKIARLKARELIEKSYLI